MEWILVSLKWYIWLFVIGIAFLPFTTRVFSKFFDHGYVFSKTIAIVAVSYITFIFGILKITAFTQFNIIMIVLLLTALNFSIFRRRKEFAFSRKIIAIFILEELIFFISFLFLVYVRGQEPSIRSLEKFMDFGFINSILRSKYFPPLDMWLSADPQNSSGYFINYYYFGHLSGALLIKLTGIIPSVGYNLLLATIFAQGMTLVFSLVGNCVAFIQRQALKLEKLKYIHIILYGLIGSFIVNLAGNLHTVYAFTRGYPNDNPIPFWQILTLNNLGTYWYPNATRFIPLTIHEFPSYSYVVADLHGHVFDIPFVLLTLSLLFLLFIKTYGPQDKNQNIPITIALGFLTAINYMTNAFDGPIYLLLTSIFLLIIFRLSLKLILHLGLLLSSFAVFSLPFSKFFSPFVNGVGINCSPNFLINLKKIGPFLFEKDKCQLSTVWMLLILWGFFWIALGILIYALYKQTKTSSILKLSNTHFINEVSKIDFFALICFAFSTALIFIPEFFYIKDIYPAHFRANTMFKLGYQAFILMGIASAYVLYRIRFLAGFSRIFMHGIYFFFFFFIFIYPLFSFPSYYGPLKKTPQLDGSDWLYNTYKEDKEIVDYFNTRVADQPVILEAQGDSYTDYERISANTGLPTVAGWWVHEWLWRGSPEVVSKRIPDIVNIYESKDVKTTLDLLKKYRVRYVVISTSERNKYKNLNESKFSEIASKIFTSSNRRGAIYQIIYD